MKANFASFAALAVLLALALVSAGAIRADHTPNPTSVTVAGSLQSELGCPGDWQPDCAATHLTYDGDDTVWQGTFNVPAGAWEYKFALNDSWTENYPANNLNLSLASQTNVKFYYDHKTHYGTNNVSSRIVTAAGSFQEELGCPGDWQPDCLRSWMQDPDNDGTYTFTTSDIPEGNYEAKAALNESWTENYPANNVGFSVPAGGADVTFSFVSSTNTFSINVDTDGHSNDNNVEYFGLGHNSHDLLYRTPFGAVPAGTEVTIRFRTYHNDVTRVRIRFYDLERAGQEVVDMERVAADVSCYDPNQPAESCDFWQVQYAPPTPTVLYYRFIINDGSATAYYDDDYFQDGGWGEATPNVQDDSYALLVHEPGFKEVEWLKNAVIYQIFPDRFRNGRSNNDPNPNEPRYGWPNDALDQILNKAWSDLPEGYCRKYVSPATPCTEGPRGRDYFGGDLMGVQQRLNYLKQLGVTAIYFNPIFEAASNHAYDTQNYYQIDHFFGTNQEFQNLVKQANKVGIRIILDGVFNHVSSDSPYFDRYGHFADVGACEDVNSPYRNWFIFRPQAGGPCAGPGGPNTMTYDAWFGFDSLPVLNKNNQEVRDLVYAADDAVARYWLEMGAAAWRLDVMGDGSFPAEFWQEFRDAVHEVNPNSPVIGELWKKHEILPKVYGDQADTAMGYRFRNAILGFLGTVDDKGFPDDGQSNQPPSVFANKLISVREDNPDASYYTMMNIMGSHDTMRILWALTPGQNNREQREFNAANLAHGKKMLRLAAVIQMTTPGAPTIYYGDEVGVTGDDDPDDRRTFPWTGGSIGAGGDQQLLAHYRKLTALRKQYSVLRQGEMTFLLTDDANGTLAYLMRAPRGAALIAVNRNAAARTLSIPLDGRLPDAIRMTDALGTIGPVQAANGVLTINLPAYSAAILLPKGGQDIYAPEAPAGLTATPGSGQVELDWNAARDAAVYNVYRSPVSGGGFVLIGRTTDTAYSDTGLPNGQKQYYVVTAEDAAGNEGAWSNEATATPAFPIGYAVLQWPKTIDYTISANPTETIYGRVYVAGLTDSGGDPDDIRAEVGFGAQGSDPANWNTWRPMSHNAGCGDCGNNFEYQGNLRPETPGVFDMLVRFSTDNGLTWAYGDQDGFFPGEPGTDNPGVLTVNPPADTTPPAAPENLSVTSATTTGIELSWDAHPDTDGDLAGFEVYRRASGGGAFTLIADLPGKTVTSYEDTNVTSGQTYDYHVKAYDASLNRSDPSNQVTATAEPRTVSITFNVDVPATTPGDKSVYIVGTLSRLDGGYPDWIPDAAVMSQVDSDTWTITLTGDEDTQLEYKYTLGSWDFVEKGTVCDELGNRTVTLTYGATGDQTVNDAVVNWRNVAPCGN